MDQINITPEIKYNAAKKTPAGRLLQWLGLRTQPMVKVYRGYGRDGQLQIFGHVLSLSPAAAPQQRKGVLANIGTLLRLFMVRPVANATVYLQWQQRRISTTTATDGFFHFQWAPERPTPAGWHPIIVTYTQNGEDITSGNGLLYIPHRTQFGCISDIDDTFLISHSGHLHKKLYVLLTRNPAARKPFEGVVQHYRLLSLGRTTSGTPNPFFYVSSSEWNLYDYLLAFADAWDLPQGVYLLNQLKTFSQLWQTGTGKHGTKFTRITRIMESYPHMSFVLLGDDTQQDPHIYEAVASHFPDRILCIYLRQVSRKNRAATEVIVRRLTDKGITCCYFEHSATAIAHSRQYGLIAMED
ncbi:DUF2183 domain-containing protein [Chitinophaga sp. Mgbs1]|uniref:DUF2183 domain-containing protein n=1 Tax=Chitinophaga solisilvae TaxID=1233460 RepID=A0A3S1D4W6_9BACT|nr:DUF2183 domain-containing protein [Chitinophaga solisilvae]